MITQHMRHVTGYRRWWRSPEMSESAKTSRRCRHRKTQTLEGLEPERPEFHDVILIGLVLFQYGAMIEATHRTSKVMADSSSRGIPAVRCAGRTARRMAGRSVGVLVTKGKPCAMGSLRQRLLYTCPGGCHTQSDPAIYYPYDEGSRGEKGFSPLQSACADLSSKAK